MDTSQIQDIRAFRLISPRLGTSGMPKEEQIPAIRRAGFDVVINLALATSEGAIPHESNLVTREGMAYFQIPVQFDSPTPADFDLFCGLMRACEGRRTFVHCAANKRVSAFVYLYRVLNKGIPLSEAKRDLQAIWEPDEVWSHFIQTELNGAERIR